MIKDQTRYLLGIVFTAGLYFLIFVSVDNYYFIMLLNRTFVWIRT